jgi:5-methylcytosine-specific restriction enzyme subunit McrC
MNEPIQRETINVVEYDESRETIFTETELQILRTEFKGRIEVAPTFTGYHVIKSREYVGTVVLPNHIIRIKPKIFDANFIYMIRYALRLPEIKPEDFLTSIYEDFYHILILFLLHHIGTILEKGLYKGYITKSDNVTFLRGKILFREHLLYNQNRNDRIYCSFSEVTLDTVENRIIKFTLFYLSKYYFIDDSTVQEILECYRQFDKITLLKSITPDIFYSVNYTPLNDHYRAALSLCELILRDSSLDIERDGEKNSLSFLINMDILFQDFVANLLRIEFGEENVILQRDEYMDIRKKLTVTPDIEILSNNRIAAIADTKYKEIGVDAHPPSQHIMQMYSYSSITEAKKCILVYAGVMNVDKRAYPLFGGITLYTLHFNLVCGSKQEFDLNCSNFTDQIRKLILG